MVGVATHQCGQVEGDAQAHPACLQQLLVTFVGFLGRSEPRELPHGPGLPAVARWMNPARVRKDAWVREVALVIERGNILRRVELIDGATRNGREASAPLVR